MLRLLTVRGLWRVERVAWAGADIGIHSGACICAGAPGAVATGSRQSGGDRGLLGKFRDVAARHRGGVSAPNAQAAATTPAQQPKYFAIFQDTGDREPVDAAGHLAIGHAECRIRLRWAAEHGEPDDVHR
jgi:hypothetical protein